MQKKILFLATSLALSLGFGDAQSQNIPFRNYCATDSMTQAAMAQYPEYARGRQEFMDMVHALNNAPQNERIKKNNGKYTIPIVVHIMHTYGTDNITDAQVMDAVRIINEDYSRTNADANNMSAPYSQLNADVEFEFKLAKIDPSGNCTSGITRTYTPLTNNADNNVKDLIRWAPNKYLNIWVVNRISFGAGGYSYLPCNVPASMEGIVILNSQFGSIGRSSGGNFAARSLTHEIGHYMGLPHTWGGSNTPGDPANCGIDDGIADTPNTIGTANMSCNLTARTCNPASYPLPDNVENFMDYSSCARMFTEGQKTVMVNALFTSNCRSNLADSANLVATGTNPGFVAPPCAPSADFSAEANRTCAGGTIGFQDQSYNLDGSTPTYSWSFPGGTPATSTDANPVITYNTPGKYDVTLTITNANGTDPITKTSAVTVTPNYHLAGVPFIRGFENPNFPTDPANPGESWDREISGNVGWERMSNVGATGTGSVRVRNTSVPAGATNALISPSISLYNVSNAYLNFKVAYAKRTATTEDKLMVYFSEDCGKTWISRFNQNGTALSTAPVTSSGNFVPQNASHWRQERILIPPYLLGNNVLLKFEVTSDGGNPIYLDDIEITGLVSGVEENLAAAARLNVFPNPSNGDATVAFDLPKAADFSLEVYTLTGQQVGMSLMKHSQKGSQEIKLSAITGHQNLKAGVYMVKLTTNGFTTLKKAVVF